MSRLSVIGSARMAATALVAALGGLVASALHLPLGWLIGAMLATAALTLMKLPTAVVPNSRQAAQGFIGIAAGLRMTPEVAARLVALLPVMLAAALTVIVFSCLISLALSRFTRLDPDTAFFSSLPGGIAEMAVLSERYGGNPGLVSIGQFLRILLVTLAIPQIVTVFPDHATIADGATAAGHGSLLPLLLLCIIGVPVALAVTRFRVPNSWLLSGIIVGAIAGLLNLGSIYIPADALKIAQIAVGITLGARCTRSVFRDGHATLPGNIAGTAVLITFSSLLAVVIGYFLHIDPVSLILALAPGGIAEMSLVAKQVGADVVLVVAFHLVRVIMVLTLALFLKRIFTGRGRETAQ
ncbi:AbrB family transcriptional regulator [Martelella alba]|uniref:AbrB family transcriptional regulator n=1 Tax=Martelella alba TaxID=2590451 RepID=A0A506TZ51_9HYPH|nr:AbrB family transcriptional regulator [Martelella alba]TPW27373.1 AbrB family transcriptional regulator [Martelella alba]